VIMPRGLHAGFPAIIKDRRASVNVAAAVMG
jgi:hypothetical protein